jgi:hypothetical protein
MANRSSMTRAEQVLARLRDADGEWVDGPELANERVGGSEGLKRLRELRDEGHPIETRKHPDPDRDIWQYRLVLAKRRGPQPVAGQTTAFFDSMPVVAAVPEGHSGTRLDPTWTTKVGHGWYDQSLRIFQTEFIELPGGRYGVRSTDLARVQDKTDWVELISPMGTAFQIPMRRLLAEGTGIVDMGERWIGAPATNWRELNNGQTHRPVTDPPGRTRGAGNPEASRRAR